MRSNLLKVWIVAVLVLLSSVVGAKQVINGAGASFPAPVYRIWSYSYSKAKNVRINYQSVGSGAGITQIKAKTVDFGASDKPLKKEELDKSGLIQFPMLIGGVVIVVNLPGVKSNRLKLSSKLVSEIFLGKIKHWNAPLIKKLNPDVRLPDLKITVVHRSDGSGTTWIFTKYLSGISQKWAEGPGYGKVVKWPTGIGGQKNPGVANNVKRIRGAIGYVEYAYAVEAGLATIILENRSGHFVAPDAQTFQAAAANADWENAPGLFMDLTNQPGKESWPITGVTYILIYKQNNNMKKIKTMLDYFSWCYTAGCATALKMHYIPMPEDVVNIVKKLWKKHIRCNGKCVL